MTRPSGRGTSAAPTSHTGKTSSTASPAGTTTAATTTTTTTSNQKPQVPELPSCLIAVVTSGAATAFIIVILILAYKCLKHRTILRRRPPYVRFINNSSDDLQMSLLSVRPHPYPALATEIGRNGRDGRQGQRLGQAEARRVGRRGRELAGEENVLFEQESAV